MEARPRRAALAVSALALVAVAISCGARSAAPEEELATSCPPAPLAGPAPQGRCSFDGTCSYAAPRGVGADWFDPVNGASCRCEDQAWTCSTSLVDCFGSSCDAPRCPFPLFVDRPCNETSNAECLLPAGSEESPDRDQVCACDLPGPVWRCIER